MNVKVVSRQVIIHSVGLYTFIVQWLVVWLTAELIRT